MRRSIKGNNHKRTITLTQYGVEYSVVNDVRIVIHPLVYQHGVCAHRGHHR